ncbi:MAG: type IV-A pilus assembly ATPase PilB [Deltaproteobacteria bacterium]|nr:type IV-A pilus assembly ATPase PilB [Deltaproteobacteria bacterium]
MADEDGAGGQGGGNLGDVLVRNDMVSEDELEEAKAEAAKGGAGLTGALARLGYVKETQLVEFLSRQYGVPSINLEEVEVEEDVIEMIPQDVAERHGIIPIDKHGSTIVVAMTDPSNIYAMDDIKFLTGFDVEAVVTSEASIESALERYYGGSSGEEIFDDVDVDEVDFMSESAADLDLDNLEDEAGEAPVVRLCNVVLVDAIKRGASDIHIEPYEKEFRIRYRIDGVLYEIMRPPMRLRNAITSRIKIMSELDIAERRLPQDGRIKLVMGKDKEVDFRVSILPTLFGEKSVLRILDKSNLQLDMTKLGFETPQLETFLTNIHQPFGMVLVTGPTGSGKTTTLYSALQDLNKVTENISTAEDPVEFNMAGINQCQMRDSIGLNFAAALRSFLRQDPDIIMVGEIRDFETAEIAIKAALTGHLVLSTLHTNDAPSTINRLLNMGVEPFLVTSSLNAIVAQRLARRICGECKEPIELEEKTMKDIGMSDEQIADCKPTMGKGCKTCNETGFKGRVALYEVMAMNDGIKEAVLQGYSAMELKKEAIALGMQTLRQSAIHKLMDGTTTVSEILRTTRADNA